MSYRVLFLLRRRLKPLLAVLAVAAVIKLGDVADEVQHLLCGGEDVLCKVGADLLRNVRRIPCFNVETIQQCALAYPLSEGLIRQRCLLAEPRQIVSVKKLMMLIKQERFQTLLHSLLTVKDHRLAETAVTYEPPCRHYIKAGMVQPIVIPLAVS